ncbi:MAG: FTR1 family protein [Chloroflexota bacterium]
MDETEPRPARSGSRLPRVTPRAILISLAAILVIGVFAWQAVTAQGSPDPTAKNLSQSAVVLDAGVLVFREGLEAILVLAALTASLVREKRAFWKPVGVGAGVGFVATLVTWFVVVAIISAIAAPALDVQAATGLLAVVVLLVVMNWFFHKIYWTGWISHHNRKRRELVDAAATTGAGAFYGLALLGFASVYREGFEVVLFLQNLRLQAGTSVVLDGAVIGVALSLVVAWLTFVAHEHLPYKRMLILTGVMLGLVLLVMVGESVQEMQQANWIGTTALALPIPDWLGLWFSVFPNVESIVAQLIAGALVIGSYVAAQNLRFSRPPTPSASGSAPR